MRLSNQCWAFGCRRTGSRDRLCSSACPPDECAYEQAIETEIVAPHRWEKRRSSGGVPIEVAQLRPSVLVRRASGVA
jgi:hypothetical protein